MDESLSGYWSGFCDARAAFLQVANRVGPEQQTQPGVCGIWSPKQVVDHLIGWDKALLTFITTPDQFVVPHDVDIFNTNSVADRHFQSWDDSLSELDSVFEALQSAVTQLQPNTPVHGRSCGWLNGRREDYALHTNQFWGWITPG